MLSEDWKMCVRARRPMLLHDWTSAFMRARKHTNAFGRLENVSARTHICAHDLVRARGRILGAHVRARKHINAFGRLENVCARTHTNAFA